MTVTQLCKMVFNAVRNVPHIKHKAIVAMQLLFVCLFACFCLLYKQFCMLECLRYKRKQSSPFIEVQNYQP